MFVRWTETFSAAILLILLAIFVLHLIRGTASSWITSKFTAKSSGTTSGGAGGGF